jgi:hypothetical protein
MLIASADVVPFYEPLGFSPDPSSVMKYSHASRAAATN